MSLVARHQLAARRRPAHHRQPRAWASSLVVYDSILVPHRQPRRPGRRVVPGLGAGLPRRWPAARRQLRSCWPSPTCSGWTRAARCGCRCSWPGVWWGPFTLIPVVGMWRLRGVERPVVARQAGIVGGSLRQLGHTFRELRHYPQTMLFLRRLPLLQRRHPDGHRPVQPLRRSASSASPRSTMLGLFLMVQFVAFGGALALRPVRPPVRRVAHRPRWARACGASSSSPRSSSPRSSSSRSSPWAWPSGSCSAARQALSRSLYSQLVPKNREAEFFSLLPGHGARDELVRDAALRPDAPVDRLLPAGHHRAHRLLRRSAACCCRGSTCARGSATPATRSPPSSERVISVTSATATFAASPRSSEHYAGYWR